MRRGLLVLALRAALRGAAAVLAGLVAWTVVATIVNLIVRATWPAYAAVEVAMLFTLPMLWLRLLIGALASLAAGLASSWVARRSLIAAIVLAVMLFAFFVPVHARLWDRFPIWYHVVFLASLLLLPVLAFHARARRGPATA